MIPLTGPISIGTVAAELGISLPLSLGDPRVRALAGKPTGPISLGDLRGKSAYAPPTIICDASAENFEPALNGQFASVSAIIGFSIQGGEAPFNVMWERRSGNMAITAGGNATTAQASASGSAPFQYLAVWRAKVTDARSTVVYGPDVTINLGAGENI